jgi:hypothetical protein
VKRAIGIFGALLVVAMGTTFFVARVDAVNKAYPEQHSFIFPMHEPMPDPRASALDNSDDPSSKGDITVTVDAFFSCDYEGLKTIVPGYTNALVESGDAGELRAYFVDVIFSNTADQPRRFSLDLDLVADYWTNGLALDLCQRITENEGLTNELAAGTKRKVRLVYLSYDIQFNSDLEWQKQATRDFSLVIGAYPDKCLTELGKPKPYQAGSWGDA